MPSKIINDDLRSIKTKRALHEAMFSLLNSQSFKKLSVKGICEQAQISRAAFYAHFIDKYDLLKHYLGEILTKNFNLKDKHDDLEIAINKFLAENKRMFTNLIYDADNETFLTLFDLALTVGNMNTETNISSQLLTKNVVLNSFFAGGLISYFVWFIKNKFPSNIEPMNKYLFQMLTALKDWQPKL